MERGSPGSDKVLGWAGRAMGTEVAGAGQGGHSCQVQGSGTCTATERRLGREQRDIAWNKERSVT